MSDTNIEGEGCRECDKLERSLELAEARIASFRAELQQLRAEREGDKAARRKAYDLVIREELLELDRLSDDAAWAEFLKHGDNEHQAWLREAIAAFIAGAPKPAPRGLGRHGAIIAEQSARIAALEADRDLWKQHATDVREAGRIAIKESLEARDRLIADLVAWDAEYYVDDGNVEFKSIIARAAAMQRDG